MPASIHLTIKNQNKANGRMGLENSVGCIISSSEITSDERGSARADIIWIYDRQQTNKANTKGFRKA